MLLSIVYGTGTQVARVDRTLVVFGISQNMPEQMLYAKLKYTTVQKLCAYVLN